METDLSNEEIRVLGCLIEKEMATPEYYPLSLNALMNACNQKSNRDPVVVYDEEMVRKALDDLMEKNFVWQSNVSRVPKYEERFVKDHDFIIQEAAVLCVLMLRGAQTTGEIRGRTERLFAFEDLEAVNNTLEDLISRGYVLKMARQPGRKEMRYSHLMSGVQPISNESVHSPSVAQTLPTDVDRVSALEKRVESLALELGEIKALFVEFKKQFE